MGVQHQPLHYKMSIIKNTCAFLLLVGACSALPQYPGQGGVDSGLDPQQQGGLIPVTSQCASNQDCVPYFQCVDGYINTDGAGLLDLRLKPTGTCTQPDYPDVPAICCNIPGVPEPPPVVDVCPFQSVCIPGQQCNGNALDTTGTMIPFDLRGSWSTCGDFSNPGVCCANPPLPTPAPLTTCPGYKVCVSLGQCDAAGNIVTDGSGLLDLRTGGFKQCYVGQSAEVGVCCNPPTTPPPPRQILDVCPLQSVCMPEILCQDKILDNSGVLVPYVPGGSWSECALDGNLNTPAVCCPNPAPLTPDYPVASQCGVRNADPVIDQRIQSTVAYNEAQFGEFSWQAIIFFSNFTFKCGASIIGDRWLLTAAHCVDGFTPYDFKIRLGEWQVNTFDEPLPYLDVDIAAVTVHPQFNPRNVHNDIAVLELVEPLAFQYHINSICLPSPGQTFWGQRCIATGWGKDSFDGNYQHIMKKVELPTVEHHQCQDLLRRTRLGQYFQLDDSFMCAGGEENKDACKGDGGGPLACQDPVTGQYVLTGITAFGIGCGNKDVPGVYADVQALLPFVQAVLSGSYDPSTFNQQQQQQQVPVEVETVPGYGRK